MREAVDLRHFGKQDIDSYRSWNLIGWPWYGMGTQMGLLVEQCQRAARARRGFRPMWRLFVPALVCGDLLPGRLGPVWKVSNNVLLGFKASFHSTSSTNHSLRFNCMSHILNTLPAYQRCCKQEQVTIF
jgi:hypothetical protein